MNKRANKKITLEVLTGNYTANIGTQNECINSYYLCEQLALIMLNDARYYEEITKNTRRKIESICWGAFLNHVNELLDWEYNGQYVATSEHLKAYIKNDYSVLSDLYDRMREEREEVQEALREEREAQKAPKITTTKKEAEALFRECYPCFLESEKDRIARRETWSNFVDMLNKKGVVTDNQANNWLYPAWCK